MKTSEHKMKEHRCHLFAKQSIHLCVDVLLSLKMPGTVFAGKRSKKEVPRNDNEVGYSLK